ncbi:MAG TPA: PQQ-dependent sugar dehydrogenase, partial [Chloroflexota bacterium]|nr:PQQ-dependent sugar dehydrogenase [Chloroflexota bacterium]
DLATIWAVDFAPDGRIFLTERSGRIRTVRDGALDPEPWLTVDGVVETGESGLMGLALDPDFSTNGYVYTTYTYAAAGGGLQNRLVRLKEDRATGRGAMDTVLLDDVRGGRVHDGGRVSIGPDNKLYWTMGDSGSQDLAQSLDTLNGKILRLNLDGSIPADNPFPGSPIYSYGHRNPQGLAWQPGTGLLFALEHGPSGQQSCCDEVNLIVPSQNYGWPRATGDQLLEGTIPPLLHSGTSRETTWAPGGATFVSSGPWASSLLFVGLRGESLYRVTLDPAGGRSVVGLEEHFKGQYGRLRDVVEGPDGALYLTTSNKDGRGRPNAGDDQLLRLTIR